MDYLIQEKITTRHTLVKQQSLNEYSHVKRSCFLNAKIFLSSNCYITDHLRLEQFVFALVDPSAHYEEILTDIRRTFLVSANMFLHEIDKKTRFTFTDPFTSIIFSFLNRSMTNEIQDQPLHSNVMIFYIHPSHIIDVSLIQMLIFYY